MEHFQPLHLIARAIITHDGKVLVCRNKNGSHFYLPGGHVEYKEPIKVALLRELEEELGMKALLVRFLGVHEYYFDTSKKKCHEHEINMYFEVHLPGVTSADELISPEDHQTFEWIDFNELDKPSFLPRGLRRTIKEWLKADYNNAFKEQ